MDMKEEKLMHVNSVPSEKQEPSLVDELTEQKIQKHLVGFITEKGMPFTDLRVASDLFGNTWFKQIETLVMPLVRFPDDFFTLSTGFAGEIVRRATNYSIRLIILGDIEPYTKKSKSFANFVRESNQGEHVWFLPDVKTLIERFSSM
jgi:Domain of unknown function (DUF4180)